MRLPWHNYKPLPKFVLQCFFLPNYLVNSRIFENLLLPTFSNLLNFRYPEENNDFVTQMSHLLNNLINRQPGCKRH